MSLEIKDLIDLPYERCTFRYTILVNNELVCIVDSLQDAKNTTSTIANILKEKLLEEKPHYTIELVKNDDDSFTLNCISHGWLKNGYRTHNVHFEQQKTIASRHYDYSVRGDVDKRKRGGFHPPNPPPVPKYTKKRFVHRSTKINQP